MGDTFGKYELVKKIARGGMAEVFLARQDGEIGGFTKHLAIKRLFPHLTEDQETIDMFLDEGRIAASLNHTNIVQIFDLGVIDDFLYIAMEYVHGRDLRSILEEGYNQDNFIPIELAASLGAQVAAGLHYAHAKVGEDGEPMNIVHRDVSPANILVSVDGGVKICDFGIAKAEHRLSHTKAGQVKGKFSYMAPEQIETSQVDARSDVFALGIVLYETTTMTRLFRADNQYEALEKILYAGIEPPTALRAGYPPELERIVMKSLERDPESRYQTAEAMQEELENWLVQNQASTSPVALARYMRGLFPELSKPVGETVPESTGPMQVSEDVVKAVDGKPKADDLEKTAVHEVDQASESAELKKKDVTEMDENDLDAALDFALGAPSEADVVLQRPSEASVSSEASFASEDEDEYVDEDATMISEQVPEIAEKDAAPASAAPRPVMPPSSTSQIVPTVTHEPTVPTLNEPSEPPPEVAPPPATAPPTASGPPASRSSVVPKAPPSATKPPAAAISSESRARAAFEEKPAATGPSDQSLDELEDASGLSSSKTGYVWGVVLLLLGLISVGLYVASMNTSGSEMEQEVERTQIDPDMLVVEVAPMTERVMVPFETTPPDAAVMVNGLPVEVTGGQLPLAKGLTNEIDVFAPGHKPARAMVEGQGGSPLSMTLEPMEEVPADESADLNIVSEPRGATVWVDGVEVGKAPTTVSGLWTGSEHSVYVELEGRFPYAGIIGLVKKSENLVEAKLAKLDSSSKKDHVEVLIKAIPRGTAVRIDGEADALGATPLFKDLDRNRILVLSLEEKDSVPMRSTIALEDVGTFELRPFLQSMKREKGTITVYVDPMGPEIYVGPNAYGQGPAGNIVLPEGSVNVVIDTPHGRETVAVNVVPNTHTRYTISHDKSGVKVTKKE